MEPQPSVSPSALKQNRKRCARWLETSCRRLRDAYCNPDFWLVGINRCVSGCVRRRVIVSFCIFETVASSVLIVPFMLQPQIALVGTFTDHWQTIIILLSIRAVCGILGAIAVHIRKVGRTKIYLGSMIVNLMLSTFVASPLHECMCSCPNRYQTRFTAQCKVLEAFTETVHIFRTTHVVKTTAGRQAFDPPMLAQEPEFMDWERISDAWQWQRHWPWQSARTQEPHLSPPRLLADPLPGPMDRYHEPGEKLAPGQISELLSYYNTTDVGVGYTRGPVLNCTEVQGLNSTTSAARRSLMLMLQCRSDEITELIKGLDPLQAFLEVCTHEPGCEAVVVSLLRVAAPAGYEEGETTEQHTLRVCRYDEPVIPFLDLSELDHSDCMCKNRCVPPRFQNLSLDENCTSCEDLTANLILQNWTRKTADLDEAEIKIARFVCRLTVTLSFILLILLTTLASWMVFVVYKFLQNRCGDEFYIEEQFQVHASIATSGPTSRWSVNDDEDDFVAVDPVASRRPQDMSLSVEMSRMSRA